MIVLFSILFLVFLIWSARAIVRCTIENIRIIQVLRLGLSDVDWKFIDIDRLNTPTIMVIYEIFRFPSFQRAFLYHAIRFLNVACRLKDSSASEEARTEIEERIIKSLNDAIDEYKKGANFPSLHIGSLFSFSSDLKEFPSTNFTENYKIIQMAVLYALVCTQLNGKNIKRRLMTPSTSLPNSEDHHQIYPDSVYLNYVETNYKPYCIIVEILNPKDSKILKIVSGYLITHKTLADPSIEDLVLVES